MYSNKQEEMPTSNRSLILFTVCRINSSSGDEYIGKIVCHQFVGHRLTIKLAPMFQIKCLGQGIDITIVLNRFDTYEFNFDECRVIQPETDGQKTTVRSETGDTIALSNDDYGNRLIDKLLKD